MYRRTSNSCFERMQDNNGTANKHIQDPSIVTIMGTTNIGPIIRSWLISNADLTKEVNIHNDNKYSHQLLDIVL